MKREPPPASLTIELPPPDERRGMSEAAYRRLTWVTTLVGIACVALFLELLMRGQLLKALVLLALGLGVAFFPILLPVADDPESLRRQAERKRRKAHRKRKSRPPP